MTILRAGKMDRTIRIERVTVSQDDYGQTQETWATLIVARAQLIQSTAKEFMRDFGAASETACIFRMRYVDGLTLADRVAYQGNLYRLKEITEIGRRRGLELRCVAQP